MASHAVGLAEPGRRSPRHRGTAICTQRLGHGFAAVLPVTLSMNRKPAVNIVTLELLRSTVQAPPPRPGLGGSQRRQFALKMFGAGVSGHDLGDQSIAA
jgi:hypothetical protein